MNPVQINRPLQSPEGWTGGNDDAPNTVTDGAVVELLPASATGNRRGLWVQNLAASDAAVWINVCGNGEMTAGAGIELAPGAGISVVPVPQCAVYALADTDGNCSVYAMEA